jgi:O-methyltransferase domain
LIALERHDTLQRLCDDLLAAARQRSALQEAAAVPEGADGYILANVLHDWDDGRAVQILQACRRGMGPRGRVLIVERPHP